MDGMSLLGQWIDEMRKRRRLTLQGMADESGISMNIFYKARKLGYRISSASLRRVAEYLGRDVDVCRAAMDWPGREVDVHIRHTQDPIVVRMAQHALVRGEWLPNVFPCVTLVGVAVQPRVVEVRGCRACAHTQVCREVVARGGLALCEPLMYYEVIGDTAAQEIANSNVEDGFMAAHNDLGMFGEWLVAKMLIQAGAEVEMGGPVDLLCDGVPVEVKTARPSKYNGREMGFQFSLWRDGHTDLHAPVCVCVCVLDPQMPYTSELEFFVIPAEAIQDRRGVAVPLDLERYAGRWAEFRQNWDVLAEVVYA